MQICGICGSPRGKESSTRRLVGAVLEGAREAGAETEFIDLCEYEIRYCTACATCYATGECIICDDFTIIYDKMLSSDGIVLGSPNYINNVSAQMKTYLDRLADAIHCQLLEGKFGCAVATAGGSGADGVAEYLSQVLITLGATSVGTLGAVMADGEVAFRRSLSAAREMGRRLVGAIQSNWSDAGQEAVHRETRERMMALVRMHEKEWPHQYEHWNRRGWS
ncbi:MAG: flavodoxin family protein [Methanoculleaceae archaeon]